MNYSLITTYPNIDLSSSTKSYLKKIFAFPMLEEDEEKELIAKCHSKNDMKAAQILVTSHLKLVAKIAIAYKYKGCELQLMDLISEGTLGLIEAIKKFDISKGCRLATYAIHHIKAKIYNFIMDSFSLVKLSSARVTKTLFGKYKQLMSASSDDEIELIAKEIDTSVENVYDMKQRMTLRDCSLNKKLNDENTEEWNDFLECNNETPEEKIITNEERKKFLTAIKIACEQTLNQEEKEIIYHRIISDNPLKLKDLASIYCVSSERIRQKQEIALTKIKNYLINNLNIQIKNF
jgi:RNA polymerase sigma-32 factor